MSRLSREPPPHNPRGVFATGDILAHMEYVPPDARPGASHGRRRMPRLWGCRPGRYRARAVPGPPPQRSGDLPTGGAPFENVDLPPLLAAPLPPRRWPCVLPYLLCSVLIRRHASPPGSGAPPPSLSPPSLLGSLPLPMPPPL